MTDWVRNATIGRFFNTRPQARHPGLRFREGQVAALRAHDSALALPHAVENGKRAA
jgi:hypothetical protein